MTDNEIILFKHEEFGEIRTLNIGGEPWFVGKDVAEKLGYVEAAKAILPFLIYKIALSFSFTIATAQLDAVQQNRRVNIQAFIPHS